MGIELVMVGVADVDRSLAFYRDQVGFHLDHDVTPTPELRVVQLTPPGSGCSLGIGSGSMYDGIAPGAVQGIHLVVDDLDDVVAGLGARGVECEPVTDFGGGVRMSGFRDPDGNGWALQELAWRKG